VKRRILLMFGGLCAALLLGALIVANPHSRQTRNEAAAVFNLREIDNLQRLYAAAHPDKGFTCELRELKNSDQGRNDADELLTTGARVGYTFSLHNCSANSQAVVVHYQATAVPVEPGVTGLRAFCASETRIVWEDESGSGANCLQGQHPLE
jgi:hypothetical protein